MNRDRSLDVTESWIGLSLMLCLLLAVGYMVLQQLGGTGQAVEVSAGFHVEPATAAGDTHARDEQQPQVLTIEGNDAGAPVVHTSQRTGSGANSARGVSTSPEPPTQSDLR